MKHLSHLLEGNAEQRLLVISISLFTSLLCASIVLGHLFAGNRWLNDSMLSISIGCAAGFIVHLATGGNSSQLLDFNEELFFVYLLPPIIFYAGFQVKKKQFFHNFGTIMLFGGAGVLVSGSIIAAASRYLLAGLSLDGRLHASDFLAIGFMFSATDTVATLRMVEKEELPLLHSVVFGEGVVNDATAIVLFRAVQKFGALPLNRSSAFSMLLKFGYLFISSTLLGVVAGLITAYIFKSLYIGRHSTDREISLMALVAYLSYTLAELFHFSGILAVFFCGVLMSHYAWHNVSESSKVTSRHVFATLSFVTETFMFLYVGADVVNMKKWNLADNRSALMVCGVLIALTALGRAAFVFPFAALSNYVRSTSSSRLTFRYQIVIWWAGLMRGAVTIALAYQQFRRSDPAHSTMICGTIGVVLFTSVPLGAVTKTVVHALLSKEGGQQEQEQKQQHEHEPEECDDDAVRILRRGSSLSLLLTDPTLAVHNFWRSFDDLYMRPVFGGGESVAYEAAWET